MQRLEYFKNCIRRFAQYLLNEYARIDKAPGLPPDTYLGIMRFGAKLSELSPKPEHECTSWIMMPDVTGGKSILMHRNRDSRGRPQVLQRRAVPGKHAWIGNGTSYSFNPTQGINDRGVVVFMNSGDRVMEVENMQYGMGTTLVARIQLEECGTAVEAVRLELHKNADRTQAAGILKKAFQDNWADLIAAEVKPAGTDRKK